mgnify:CR=1 FL=1
MAFLDRSTLIVDAVLTRLGRQRLSENAFTIEKFALGDDEIDYALYNEGNSNGPNSYGIIIDNMPIHEAFTHISDALKYKLVTRPVGANTSPTIGASIPDAITLTGEADYVLLSPDTVGALMGTTTEDYIFELSSDMTTTIVLGDIGQQEQAIAEQTQQAMMGVIIRQQYIDLSGQLEDAMDARYVTTFRVDGVVVGEVPEFESTLEVGEYLVQNTPKQYAAVDSVTVTGGIDIINSMTGEATKQVRGMDASDFILKVMEPGIITVVSQKLDPENIEKDARKTAVETVERKRRKRSAEKRTKRRAETRETTMRDEEERSKGQRRDDEEKTGRRGDR